MFAVDLLFVKKITVKYFRFLTSFVFQGFSLGQEKHRTVIKYSTCVTIEINYFKVKMKLDSEEFKALFTPELQKLASLFEKNAYELNCVL